MERLIQKKKEKMEMMKGNSEKLSENDDKKNESNNIDENSKRTGDMENNNNLQDDGAAIKDEEALLELALDNIQNDTGGKTREEAELDRQKLLAGELLVEGGGGDIEIEDIDDVKSGIHSGLDLVTSDERNKTEAEKEAEILKQAGYSVVSDDECIVLGATSMKYNLGKMLDEESEEDFKKRMKKEMMSLPPPAKKIKVIFHTNFDVIELDEEGKIIDIGDEDFTPSKIWIGRKGGFEFKLGARGLGYYRTGKKVVVPSNIAY